MRTMTSAVSLALAVFLFVGFTVSDEKKPEGKKIEAKAQPRTSAATIDFAKDLGLGFSGLTSLGTRIEQARMQTDPVGLALAAQELAVAEKVSGKCTSLRAEALIKEAVTLAKLRFVPAEINAVQLLVGTKGEELNGVAEKAEKVLAAIKKAREQGEQTRGITGQLHVDSRVNVYIRVSVNGRYVGIIPPMGDIYPWVGDSPWQTTVVSAISVDGSLTWGPILISREVRSHRWILH